MIRSGNYSEAALQAVNSKIVINCLLVLWICCVVLLTAVPVHAKLEVLRVVSDDNYPPYIFRDKDGLLVGLIVDQWRLWEQVTDIKVDLQAFSWSESIRRMQAGEFDVIDTLFQSEERAKVYDFLKPYADIDVPLFFHSDLSGIRSAADAVGFAVGAKAGDNVIGILKKAGVGTIVEFPSYEALVKAAAQGTTKVFSVDRPPALYFLNKFGIANQFRESPPLYRGQFHRAVLKGKTELAGIVQMGFDAIPSADLEQINNNWLGRSLNNQHPFWRIMPYIVLIVTSIIMFMALWLQMLRKMVNLRTDELLAVNDSLKLEIVERKKAEEEKGLLQNQLQQAMKMEAVGRLAGGVAHDFNNLLTAIIGNASLANMDLETDSKASENIREIEKAARSAALLTQQLLAFSRRQNIEPKVLNINDIVESLCMMLGRLAGDRIQMQLYPADNLWNVMLDPGQFERILINLVLNARDAMPDGGRITVTTANVSLSEADCLRRPEADTGDYVRLTFSDSGHGMTTEVKNHLFEPFFTTKPRGRGTGLGLSAIYGIIKHSGGFIEVCSEVEKGTTFDIFVPRTTRQPAVEEVESSSGLSGGSETVLLVEDEDIVRFIGAEILKKFGYNLLQAANGMEALELASKFTGKIDLMLTDLMMPGMTGRELAEKIVAVRPDTKILFTSACADDVIDGQEIADQGLNFIAKPFSVESLALKIRQVLGKSN